MIVSKWVATDRLLIEIGGNWHYKIIGWIVLRSKLILFIGPFRPLYFWMIVSKWVVKDRLSIEIGGNWHYKIFGWIVLRSKLI